MNEFENWIKKNVRYKPFESLSAYNGRKISVIRNQIGLTQVEMSRLLGKHPMTISKWELGKSNPSLLEWSYLEELRIIPLKNISSILNKHGSINTLYIILKSNRT